MNKSKGWYVWSCSSIHTEEDHTSFCICSHGDVSANGSCATNHSSWWKHAHQDRLADSSHTTWRLWVPKMIAQSGHLACCSYSSDMHVVLYKILEQIFDLPFPACTCMPSRARNDWHRWLRDWWMHACRLSVSPWIQCEKNTSDMSLMLEAVLDHDWICCQDKDIGASDTHQIDLRAKGLLDQIITGKQSLRKGRELTHRSQGWSDPAHKKPEKR